jgi:hypothetical protein
LNAFISMKPSTGTHTALVSQGKCKNRVMLCCFAAPRLAKKSRAFQKAKIKRPFLSHQITSNPFTKPPVQKAFEWFEKVCENRWIPLELCCWVSSASDSVSSASDSVSSASDSATGAGEPAGAGGPPGGSVGWT